MKFLTTRTPRSAASSNHQPASQGESTDGASLRTAMLDGLAPDGGLYVPESIEPWQDGELARLGNRTLTEIAYRVGFNSSSHFSTKFHRKFGVRPSDVKHGNSG